MRFLANENFPKPSVTLMRLAGYDVTSVAEEHQGISDQSVVEMAKRGDLIILTFDKDYGEIIFKQREKGPPSVVTFKFKGSDPEFAGRQLIYLIEEKKVSFQNAFTVVEQENVRRRLY